MRILLFISRLIIGIVFIFSGFVKAVDPLGTTYKFQDYLSAFKMNFLKDFSLFLHLYFSSVNSLPVFQCCSDLAKDRGMGYSFNDVGIHPLTLILALTNPVSDCGCFGDAIHLTNWQTFIKNVILLAPALIIFIKEKRLVHHWIR